MNYRLPTPRLGSKVLRRLKMIAAVVFAAATAYMVGQLVAGLIVDIPVEAAAAVVTFRAVVAVFGAVGLKRKAMKHRGLLNC